MKRSLPRPKDRREILEQRRNLKMARSAYAYVRGTPLKFYEWLESDSAKDLPQGPHIWICGDCHVSNLGPVASDRDKVEIEIRDFDQTVIGNPAHDLVRLGLSLATAARGFDLPGVTTAQMLEKIIEGYVHGLRHPRTAHRREAQQVAPVEKILRKALKRDWRQLAEERIADESPTMPLGKCFWPLSKEEKKEIEDLFSTEEMRKLVTRDRQRETEDKISVADAAYWVKGCSSLGHLRYAVLVKVGKNKKGIKGFSLIDIKEAVRSDAPHAAGASLPRDNAKRIVKGACSLSPYLGERLLAGEIHGRPVVIRELRPQDLKIEMSKLSCEEAVNTAHLLAEIVGRAHGRQMDVGSRQKWIAALDTSRSKNIDAPSWLWTSVVDLMAVHEKAYLDHCREYALHAE
jgi:uncharacterized protein (DUF2252 family)